MRKLLGVAAATVLLALSGGTPAAHAVAAPTDVATSIHGSVETQALTIGNGAAALLVDPGTAYAYSTVDRDDYGEGSSSLTMTARGANLNLGTIALAVIWAAPSCTPAEGDPVSTDGPCLLSGGTVPGVTPNTGLHEAKGFPAYAEALYPPPPPDVAPAQDRVYKCVINKDGPGAAPSGGQLASICKQSDAIPLTAWAEAIGEEYRATGFSRAAGFDAGTVKVAGSESYSQVVPITGGKLVSEGYSMIHNISLLGGQITVDAVKAAARIVSNASGEATRSGACTFSGLKVAGQNISSNGSELPAAQVQPLLDSINQSTGYLVDIIPPTPVVSTVIEGSKQVVSCTGLRITFTDTHTQSPVPVCLPVQPDPTVPQCVPALANREEFTFGTITVQQSVNDNAGGGLDSLGGGADTSVAGLELSASPSDTVSADLSAAGASTTTDLGLGGGSASGSLRNGGGTANGNVALGNSQNAAHLANSGALGVLTAVSALAWLVAIFVLIGVVNSLATGRPLRLPGF